MDAYAFYIHCPLSFSFLCPSQGPAIRLDAVLLRRLTSPWGHLDRRQHGEAFPPCGHPDRKHLVFVCCSRWEHLAISVPMLVFEARRIDQHGIHL